VRVNVVVNGVPRTGAAEPRTLLSDFLRHQLGLTGTHVGCEHGVCGACTVQLDGEPIRSCLMLAVQADGRCLRTVEGLAGPDDELTPLQRCFSEHHALQCGFCTAGFLLTAEAFLRRRQSPSEREIREALAGNLCRCTGYEGIVAAVQAAAQAMAQAEAQATAPGEVQATAQGEAQATPQGEVQVAARERWPDEDRRPGPAQAPNP
jgi:aerobic carbon-monoxide dehydrogenase small subunit